MTGSSSPGLSSALRLTWAATLVLSLSAIAVYVVGSHDASLAWPWATHRFMLYLSAGGTAVAAIYCWSAVLAPDFRSPDGFRRRGGHVVDSPRGRFDNAVAYLACGVVSAGLPLALLLAPGALLYWLAWRSFDSARAVRGRG